jgi:hypothetical protein
MDHRVYFMSKLNLFIKQLTHPQFNEDALTYFMLFSCFI